MDTAAVLDLMREVADAVIRPRFRALAPGEIDEKSPGDYVTAADREAEALLTEAFRTDDPGCLVVGEEATFADPAALARLPAAAHAWVVDPVDGTRNFVHGSPDYAVMVAEVRAGETTRAWILLPEHGLAYVAERGGGTWRNDARMAPPLRNRPLVGASSRQRRGTGPGVPGEIAPIVPTSWCCGRDYPNLLEGRWDFVGYYHGNAWDHLPGSLLLAELGGLTRTRAGEAYRAGVGGPHLIAAADEPTWAAAAGLLYGPPSH